MASKKTNKTEHVMSLLVGQADETDQTAAAGPASAAGQTGTADQTTAAGPASAAGQTIESQTVTSQTILNQTIKAQTIKEQRTTPPAAKPEPEQHLPARPAAPPPGIMFVESSKSEDNPISSAIKESLEREAAQMGLIKEIANEDSKPETEQPEDGEEAAAPEQVPIPAPAVPPLEQTEVPAPIPAPEVSEPSYRYLNVMEEGVKDRCIEFMEKLGVCTCDRCRQDVTALALSNLPAKYIVADSAAVAPLMNYYKNKYASYIMAELTKACFAVNDCPRH